MDSAPVTDASSDPVPDIDICNLCLQAFKSRNQLFKHLRHCKNKDFTVAEAGPSRLVCVTREPGIFRVVVKPQGLPTNGGRDIYGLCAQNHEDLILEEELRGGKTTLVRALPAHRLDSGTGGLLLCSESIDAERSIKYSFTARLIEKRYHACVVGDVQVDSGEVAQTISGQTAYTAFRVLSRHRSKTYGNLTIVELIPFTGRRHQLRRHMQFIGHPILGDPRYSHTIESNLYLWAVSINFPHPSIRIEKLREMTLVTSNDVAQRRVSVNLPQQEMLFSRLLERESL